jgi:hypothetical protein
MANGRGDKDPTQGQCAHWPTRGPQAPNTLNRQWEGHQTPPQGPILTHQRATSTQQQETPQWPMGGATKTQPKAQH